VATFMSVLELMTCDVVRHLFDFTTSGRTLVQSAFRTQHGTGLAALSAKRDFAAFTAEDDVPSAIHRRTAAEDRSLVQAADRAEDDSFLAALVAAFHFSAFSTQSQLGVRIVRVGYPYHFRLAAT
jgi:hypothetical protein